MHKKNVFFFINALFFVIPVGVFILRESMEYSQMLTRISESLTWAHFQHVSLLFVRLQLTWPEDLGILRSQVETGSITLHLFHKLKKWQT
jgi:hypothetical protein